MTCTIPVTCTASVIRTISMICAAPVICTIPVISDMYHSSRTLEYVIIQRHSQTKEMIQIMNHGPLRVAYRPRPQTKKDDSNHDACSVREPRVIICIIFLLVSGTDWYMLHDVCYTSVICTILVIGSTSDIYRSSDH